MDNYYFKLNFKVYKKCMYNFVYFVAASEKKTIEKKKLFIKYMLVGEISQIIYCFDFF